MSVQLQSTARLLKTATAHAQAAASTPVGGPPAQSPWAVQLAPPGNTGTWGRLYDGVLSGVVKLFDPTGGGSRTVTVRGGDSLSAIAQRELGDGSRWREIFDANRDQLANPNVIHPGQVLKLPGGAPAAPAPAPAPAPAAPARYTVTGGDTLYKIAQKTLGNGDRWQEIFNANRDQLANPNLVYPGQSLAIPGGRPGVAPTPAPAPSSGGFGGQAVAAGRQLQAQGYRYTVNLTTNYHPVRFKIGCCADFAVDAWAKAGVDIYSRINNPHYCPNLVNYFKNGTDGHKWVGAGGRAQPGDMVFFSWDGGPGADHVAIVTEVDGNGKPTKIIESYNFNLPVRERAVGSSLNNILGYGRA
jgi:LysM repeat protein